MKQIIQGLWIGSELSMMEQLSIASFLKNGHDYHLYVYGDVKGIPQGTVIQDGNEILPASLIFQYKQDKSYSAFSNFFRYKLLLDKGGWWVDTDTICLKPFTFDDPYVFSTELWREEETINCGIIKVPMASQVMAYAWATCQTKNPDELGWGEVGPKLMAEAVKKFALEKYVKTAKVFCPLGFKEWGQVLEPTLRWDLDETTYAIHLWNEMWRRGGQGKNRRYHTDCLYEQLKEKYLGNTETHSA